MVSVTKELTEFCHEILLVYKSGYSLAEVSEVLTSPLAKRIRLGIKQGILLSNLLTKQGVPNIYIAMLRAGESSGNVALALQNILNYLDTQLKFKQKIVKALIYPACTLTVALIVLVAFYVIIKPMYQGLLMDTKVEDDFNFWWLFLLSGYFVKDWVWQQYQTCWVFRDQQNILVLRSFSLGLKMSLSELTSLEAVRDFSPPQIAQAINQLKSGKALSGVLLSLGWITAVQQRWLSQAERCGQLKMVLLELVDRAEQDYFNKLEQIMFLVEPAVTIITGLLIGLLAWSMLQPAVSVTGLFLAD